ncbi:histidine ammonia-lyase [Burkholderia plantarii]|uniref:Histidine ammonia-lyase HutH n=1 Tax=Burkholderia plantarii TaxID=41899 RepID=A0A0B6RR13_BURPL|nr:histidine ammonia-lyase HutH [Burkholderia plantarii]ALK30063.1 Histidine ammonia-lyase [Burkholderia plantarii]GLZ21663.1 histidine ammonia-lyase [Burkholderia plantarii]
MESHVAEHDLNEATVAEAEATAAHEPVVVGGRRLSIEEVVAISRGAPVALSEEPAWRARIERGAAWLRDYLAGGGTIYGVTTGYGDACVVEVPPALVEALPLQLTRYHGCGMGAWFDDAQTLAIVAARLTSLAYGYSGVRLLLLERLADLVNHRILPRIPSEGSVGASGDLTPLSYVAAALAGERTVRFDGGEHAADAVWGSLGRAPLVLAPKEGLALMNGTAVMTGLACLAFARADHLTRIAARLTALTTVALDGRAAHFDATLFEAKPHAGQAEAAAWIRDDLAGSDASQSRRLQDRYSVRCAPHVIGVARDALSWVRRDVENELNSANDNPLIDPDDGRVLHGGNFYGGHIAFAMDALKTAVANLADLMDRQLALLVDEKFSNGLPRNLTGAPPARAPINHGFKAVQISSSAWTAEALKLTMPASVFSRSTESHNQDKVSMGTIAARDCLRVLELTEQVAAAHTLATVQAVRLRRRIAPDTPLPAALRGFVAEIDRASPLVEEDRPLEAELRALTARLAACEPIGAEAA